jgi:hypothetical protein
VASAVSVTALVATKKLFLWEIGSLVLQHFAGWRLRMVLSV